MKHCDRAWWKRPPVWFIAVAAVLLLIGAGVEFSKGDHAGPMAYGAFLDQLEGGTIASVTIQGTEIRGRFKQSPNALTREPEPSAGADSVDPVAEQAGPEYDPQRPVGLLRSQPIAAVRSKV
jgi:hypothetical protein